MITAIMSERGSLWRRALFEDIIFCYQLTVLERRRRLCGAGVPKMFEDSRAVFCAASENKTFLAKNVVVSLDGRKHVVRRA